MDSARRVGRWVAAAAVGAALLVSCEAPAEPGSPSPSPTVAAAPGRYTFSLSGLAASLDLQGTSGELEVRNGTDRPLGAPGIVWLGAVDGRERQAIVRGAEPIPPGETVTVEVDFPAGFRPQRAGLIILTLDSVRWGALNPP